MKFALQKAGRKVLLLLCILCGAQVSFSLDREAFSIVHYDLDVRVEPEQHRLAARGNVLLRNDSATPQKIAVLQVSSSLDWRSIKAADKQLQFVRQPLTSDIDHTGGLSEAIVTLPQEVPPHATIALDIAYEGVILLDATRLIRIGAPEEAAKATDWDQIDSTFTGVRGIGHVAWYPITTGVVNLSEEGSLFEALERWKRREAGATARIKISVSAIGDQPQTLLANDPSCTPSHEASGQAQLIQSDWHFRSPGAITPTFVLAEYGEIDRRSIQVFNLSSHAVAGEAYANAVEKIAPLIADWFGPARERVVIADLPDKNASPFESGAFLLTPLGSINSKLTGLAAAHQLAHASFSSPRLWINEGLAHFAQAVFLEQDGGRRAALDYLAAHRSALHAVGPPDSTTSGNESQSSLADSTSEEFIRSKALCVWWMLRDLIGDPALKKAIAAYKPEQDEDLSYMPRLIAAQTPRDLQWFFDDWIYHNHGLPNFRVESAFSHRASPNLFVLTIALENTGTAGAEVPVIIRMPKGESVKRIEVRAKSKTTFRVETPAAPQEIVVNDGSVPESETKDNVFKVAPPQS